MTYIGTHRFDIGRGAPLSGEPSLKRRRVHILDVKADPEFTFSEGLQRGRRSAPCSAFRCCARAMPIGVLSLTRKEVRPFHRKTDRAGHDLRRPGGDRDRERAAVRKRGGPHARTGASRWRTCAPRRTAWCRRRSSPRSVSSPPASRTRSRTRSISSTISRRSRSNSSTNCGDALKAFTSTIKRERDQRD